MADMGRVIPCCVALANIVCGPEAMARSWLFMPVIECGIAVETADAVFWAPPLNVIVDSCGIAVGPAAEAKTWAPPLLFSW